MKLILCLAALAVVSADSRVQQSFDAFVEKFNKQYETQAEYTQRLSIFADNLKIIAAMNEEHMLVNGEAVFGVGKFADLTHEEFRAAYLMNYVPMNVSDAERVSFAGQDVPNDVDWRTKGAVTRVKDQGRCGSCWAFSATAAIESYAKLSGKYGLETLSPQQINSCDKRDGGCNGGNTETAYRYVQSAGGIETESSYPYTSGGGRTGTCHFDHAKIAVSITGYHSVSRGESNLAGALANGPASVCLAADAFQHYHSGILSSCPGRIDHCVQTVGYASDYWIIRNSWGTGWGEAGYLRLKRGSDLCHVADDVTYPTF